SGNLPSFEPEKFAFSLKTLVAREPVASVIGSPCGDALTERRRGGLVRRAALYPAEQRQNHDDDQHNADNAARPVAPAAAVAPCGQCANQHKNEDDDEDR